MVVQHNISAMNANRMLGVTTSAQAKSTEKLSSGYKINRAADDAAGLSISEKMRKQIRGLTQATSNAQDGISAVQTAEGALTEVHDMLQRMNELATKAANGTESASDRGSIQDEISQLTTEIDRVAETSKFNEMYLLKGGSGTKNVKVEAHDAGLKGTLADQGATATFTTKFETDSDISISGTDYHIYAEEDTVEALQGKVSASTTDKVTIDGTTYTRQIATKNADTTISSTYGKHVGSIYKPKASIKRAEDSIKTLNESTAKLTDAFDKSNSAIKTAKGATSIGELATSISKAVSAIKKNGSVVNNITKSIATLKSYIASATKAAKDEPNFKAIKNADRIFLSNGKEYSEDTIKSLIIDGAKVGIGDSKARTAVDTVNNKKNITIDDAKNKVQEALTQANRVGVDDETVVSVGYTEVADSKTTATKADGSTTTTDGDTSTVYTITKGSVNVAKALDFNLHVGVDADLTNKISVGVETMNSKYLGIQDLNVKDDTGLAATYAIDAISDAIAKVSEQRSALGAVQNRLEHTIKNLNNVVENTTSAESQIRDTDMATEMVQYSKNNILAQAGQSMLAQANQSNQGVLSLLQ